MSYPFSAPGHNLPVVSTAYLFSVLGIITVAIVLSVWVLKTVARGKSSHSRILVLKESLYLGNKSFLHAVAVQDKLLVIGVSPHGISTLAELENIATSQPAASVPAAPFAQILTNLLASGQPAKHPEQNIALSPSSDAKATKTP